MPKGCWSIFPIRVCNEILNSFHIVICHAFYLLDTCSVEEIPDDAGYYSLIIAKEHK